MATTTASPTIAGVVHVDPEVHRDERGTFVETYRRSWFPDGAEMVQGNRAERRAGSLVGLHFHRHQADYWYVAEGLARVVLHDLRRGSPTEGATLELERGAAPGEPRTHEGLYIPAGVAHGFAALTDLVLTYLVDRYFDPADELGIAWDDPEVGASWGVDHPELSPRDRANPTRAQLPEHLWPTARATGA